MQKISRQGIEQVGKDKLLAVKLLLFISFGQHGVGCYAREKGHGKAGPGNVLESSGPDQWCGKHGHEPGPVHGFNKIAHKHAQGNEHAQFQKGEDKACPEFRNGKHQQGLIRRFPSLSRPRPGLFPGPALFC